MHEYRFDRDTAVAPIDRRRAAVELHPEWNVDGRILNGGYLQAVVLRAAVAACPTAGQPVAVSSLFAAAPTPGPAVVDAEVLRAGRRVTAVSATLRQEDAVIASSLVTVAADGALPAADRAAASLPMPPVPPPEACVRVAPAHLPGPPGLADLVDYAFVPDNSRWLSGDTSGGPHIRCWMSFADGRPLDLLAALAMVDMAPPVCFAQGRFGWAPTLQLQVGVFALPIRGPFLLDLRGEPYEGAIVAEDGLLWDSDGTLIARSRQIALAPRE
ncbi:MAG: hypothetical protein BGO26_08525 [Actinobacteria bacterium 69-20]|jgi:acyl-coenzyme A thioesterase PaaI-like protein|nr:thioesterase family protein [Actinomycetota bacterium]OJV30344.1 MAG: hypothetical protein BGO26_08525 [Actinobacteria bacterium 69-20]